MKLKCYFAGSKDWDEFQFCDVVFAESHKAARKLVWNHGQQIREACDGEFFALTLTHQKNFDSLAIDSTEYVVNDAETLREMGWMREGEWACESCEMGAYGLERYTVCTECNNCNDCGHLDGCAENKG